MLLNKYFPTGLKRHLTFVALIIYALPLVSPQDIGKPRYCPRSIFIGEDGKDVTGSCSCYDYEKGGAVIKCKGQEGPTIVEKLKAIGDITIQSLTMAHADIIEIGPRAFRNLRIKRLNLDYNQIRSFHPDALRGLEFELQHFSVAHNKLTEVPTDALTDMLNLLTLDLRCNNIGNLYTSAFRNNTNLVELNLACNQICIITPNAFDGIKLRLQSLILDHNCLTEVPAAALRGFTSLLGLHLVDNQIAALGKLQFMNLLSLIMIRLSGNGIRSIHPQAFTNIPSLRYLYLDRNKLTTILPYKLQQFRQLEMVDLSYNNLAEIARGTFANIHRLIQLNLVGNMITDIQPGAFAGSPILVLLLGQNCLNSVTKQSFQGLPFLRHLSLQNNNLRAIQAFAFAEMSNLELLDIRENKIETVPTVSLAYSPKTTILLQENPLVCTQAYHVIRGGQRIQLHNETNSVCRVRLIEGWQAETCPNRAAMPPPHECCRIGNNSLPPSLNLPTLAPKIINVHLSTLRPLGSQLSVNEVSLDKDRLNVRGPEIFSGEFDYLDSQANSRGIRTSLELAGSSEDEQEVRNDRNILKSNQGREFSLKKRRLSRGHRREGEIDEEERELEDYEVYGEQGDYDYGDSSESHGRFRAKEGHNEDNDGEEVELDFEEPDTAAKKRKLDFKRRRGTAVENDSDLFLSFSGGVSEYLRRKAERRAEYPHPRVQAKRRRQSRRRNDINSARYRRLKQHRDRLKHLHEPERPRLSESFEPSNSLGRSSKSGVNPVDEDFVSEGASQSVNSKPYLITPRQFAKQNQNHQTLNREQQFSAVTTNNERLPSNSIVRTATTVNNNNFRLRQIAAGKEETGVSRGTSKISGPASFSGPIGPGFINCYNSDAPSCQKLRRRSRPKTINAPVSHDGSVDIVDPNWLNRPRQLPSSAANCNQTVQFCPEIFISKRQLGNVGPVANSRPQISAGQIPWNNLQQQYSNAAGSSGLFRQEGSKFLQNRQLQFNEFKRQRQLQIHQQQARVQTGRQHIANPGWGAPPPVVPQPQGTIPIQSLPQNLPVGNIQSLNPNLPQGNLRIPRQSPIRSNLQPLSPTNLWASKQGQQLQRQQRTLQQQLQQQRRKHINQRHNLQRRRHRKLTASRQSISKQQQQLHWPMFWRQPNRGPIRYEKFGIYQTQVREPPPENINFNFNDEAVSDNLSQASKIRKRKPQQSIVNPTHIPNLFNNFKTLGNTKHQLQSSRRMQQFVSQQHQQPYRHERVSQKLALTQQDVSYQPQHDATKFMLQSITQPYPASENQAVLKHVETFLSPILRQQLDNTGGNAVDMARS